MLQELLRVRIHKVVVLSVRVMAPGVLQEKKGGFKEEKRSRAEPVKLLVPCNLCSRRCGSCSTYSVHTGCVLNHPLPQGEDWEQATITDEC